MTQQPTDKTFDFESARARLMSIAWRMLGTRAEAEDIVQDAWLKWQAADALAVRSPVAWLTTITTRLAIDRLRRLSAEQAARENEWLPEPWRDAFIPSAEDDVLRASSLSHGLTLLFERLSADERAAFVLHEAFDCDYAQVAEVIGKNPAHCRQLVHRARERLQRPARPAFASTPNESARTRVLTRLAQTIEHGDIAGAMELFGQSTVFVAEAAPGETAVAVAGECTCASRRRTDERGRHTGQRRFCRGSNVDHARGRGLCRAAGRWANRSVACGVVRGDRGHRGYCDWPRRTRHRCRLPCCDESDVRAACDCGNAGTHLLACHAARMHR